MSLHEERVILFVVWRLLRNLKPSLDAFQHVRAEYRNINVQSTIEHVVMKHIRCDTGFHEENSTKTQVLVLCSTLVQHRTSVCVANFTC